MLLAQLNVTNRSSRTTALIATLLTLLLQPLVLAIGLCFVRCYEEREQDCVREATTLLTCAYTHLSCLYSTCTLECLQPRRSSTQCPTGWT